jgi:cation transport regulator ChaC
MNTIAILAYGSLIDDPGSEFVITDRPNVTTPFPVEYARSSAKRAGGPTLVPVSDGFTVSARLLVLAPSTTITEAKNMLWRRETRNTSGTYNPPNPPTSNTVLIDILHDFASIHTVLFTRIAPNITPLTPERLANLAIQSASDKRIPRTENGISYLLRAKSAGVITRMTHDYEAAILQQTGATSLEHALQLTYDRNA